MSAGSATAGLFFFRFLYKPEYQQVTVMLPMLAEQVRKVIKQLTNVQLEKRESFLIMYPPMPWGHPH